jgi:hypothetical protein
MAETVAEPRPSAWWVDADDGPGPGLCECVAAAVAAPSVHTTQPWLFRPGRGGIDLYADRDRQLRVIDPSGRELAISIGAAAFNLRVAILARGRTPVQRLLPAPDVPDLLVRITLGPPGTPTETVRALWWAIPRRRSNRWPFSCAPC